MNKFIRELRRREVFQTTGLYVGVCWILIEVSSVLLPTFDAAEWIMRALVIVSIAGFPVMLVLAWVYNVTDHGVEVQADPTDTIVAPFGSRKTDITVIGILSVALVLSLTMNFADGPAAVQELQPLSVLIADFDNQTGDPLFDGSLEQVLNIGIEGASFITAHSRAAAKNILENLRPAASLDGDGARLVAVREGIKIVIAGSIVADNGGYKLTVSVLRPEDGELAFRSSATAQNKLEVLGAVSELAEALRTDLGDTGSGGEGSLTGEMFTSISLEALQQYSVAQELVNAARYEESLTYYEAAVREEPDFGRALSEWALGLYYLGRREQAATVWKQARSKMGGMTARERYRMMGRYYLAVTGDYQQGIDSYSALVEAFPADSAGYSSLAKAYLSTLDFKKAREAGSKALEIYPKNKVMLSDQALYSLYAGDFDMAEQQGRSLLAIDRNYYRAWLPIALSAAAGGDVDKAVQHYDAMSATGAALARLGKADLAQFSGNFAEAARLVKSGMQREESGAGKPVRAASYLVLAKSQQALGDADGARTSLEAALAIATGSSTQVAAALLRIELEDLEAATALGEQLSENAQPHAQAYARLIEGAVALAEGNNVAAVDALRSGVQIADLWLIRFYLGRAYLQAGFFAEAMDEFMLCRRRQGEVSALFLNDLPTWRYMASLPYWLGRAQQKLGMEDAAKASYQHFLAAYNAVDPLTKDAAGRLQ